MQTLKQMSEAELLAWAISFRSTVVEITIGKRDGTPKTFQETVGDFPANSIEKHYRYGFQRTHNDAVGGEDKFASFDEKIAAVEAMIERFKNGDVGRQPRESVDPFANECRIVLRAHLRKHNKKLWAEWKNDEIDAINARLDEISAKPGNKWVRDAAQKALDAKRESRAIVATQKVEL